MAFTYDQHGQSYPQQQYPRTQPPMSSAEYYAQLDPVYPPHSEDANTGNNSQPSSTTERQQYSETTVPLLPSKDNAIPRLDDAQYFPPPESKSSIRPQRDTAFSPYLSKTSAFLSIWVPFTILALTLGGLWGLVLTTQMQKDHILEVRSHRFYDFAIDYPTRFLAVFTFISSTLKAIIVACFGCAVLSYTRFRLSSPHNSMSLKVLSALSYARSGEFPTFSEALTSRRGWLCFICWILFLATTASINTIISPIKTTINQEIWATELDMTSPSFNSFYRSQTGFYYNCGFVDFYRGISVTHCPAEEAFNAVVNAGRAYFESTEFGQRTYIRLGPLTYTGTTGGTIPFTSYNSNVSQNAIQSTSLNLRYPSDRQNYTIALTNQGLRANISCRSDIKSPLYMGPYLMVDRVSFPCDPNTQAPFPLANESWQGMRAGYCNSTSQSENGSSLPTYELYMRFTTSYTPWAEDGRLQGENVTCTITPYATLERSEFRSTDNSTIVTQISENGQAGVYPQALVERILTNLMVMINVVAQTSDYNFIAQQIQQITLVYYQKEIWQKYYSERNIIAERLVEGMFSFLASYERLIAEKSTLAMPTDLLDLSPFFLNRTRQTGYLQYDAYAYRVNVYSYLRLIPITVICLLGMWILFYSSYLRPVTRFNPLDTISLITAASSTSHSLFLDKAAMKGAAPDDEEAGNTYIAFDKDHKTGQWGLKRVPWSSRTKSGPLDGVSI